MYVPTEVNAISARNERKQKIFYAGNLGLGRAEQLVLMGRAIKSLGRTDITHIDVYSSEVREELTSLMTEENGIVFHGEVSSDHILRLMNENKYVIHTESFDMDYKTRVMYSVSTKIADCLSCGACIIAFGPTEVASIDYLNRSGAAWIIENEETLTAKLRELFEDDEKSAVIVSNALELSEKNHNNKKVAKAFKNSIFDLTRK
jgi:glycosyltransferase involved in cell wall biosynthesis